MSFRTYQHGAMSLAFGLKFVWTRPIATRGSAESARTVVWRVTLWFSALIADAGSSPQNATAIASTPIPRATVMQLPLLSLPYVGTACRHRRTHFAGAEESLAAGGPPITRAGASISHSLMAT